ncbi:hypothetical protein OKW21_002552 [Catalinimonas alkaloidigena]|uniref:hypothetical protein n=1 Tax=Catalinimonas alkaloidigena TaxID=1075417 RepID=UPI002405E31C|nr:hypothetical protein [Catalinimonas alkaloidigena]MDF9797289.1 hypothetical protein [Catalinimonas alkaloidigena]
MNIQKAFGIFFTLLGTAILMLSVYAMISGPIVIFETEVTAMKAIIPAILGIIFFSAGVKFFR